MPQNFGPKQAGWVTRFSSQVVALLTAADALQALCTEYADDTYGTGGANAITDAAVQSVLPAATAVQIAEAEGALAGASAVLATIASNRGFLEMARP